MKERPILFSGPMVRAILEGRKTQTRRVAPVTDLKIKDHGDGMLTWSVHFSKPPRGVFSSHSGGKFSEAQARSIIASQFCPYGAPGDRLWVRETWMDLRGTGIEGVIPGRERWAYGEMSPAGSASDEARRDFGLKWRPSIFMPREASRLLLEITEVRVQRLQEITAEDAVAEGAQRFTGRVPSFTGGTGPSWSMGAPTSHGECLGSARFAFANFWNRTVRVAELDWDSNPWVWAITFRRVEQ